MAVLLFINVDYDDTVCPHTAPGEQTIEDSDNFCPSRNPLNSERNARTGDRS